VALAVFSSAFFAGCQTAAQHQGQIIKTTSQTASAELRACESAVYALAEFNPLRRHIPPVGEQPSLEQLTDASLATDDEIRALYSEHPKSNKCRQQYLDRLSPVLPGFVVIIAGSFTESENSLIDLIQKKQTWGDHTRRVKALSDSTRPQLVREGQRIDAGLEQSHEAELARRQAVVQAIANFVQTQEAIDDASRPVVTTCNSFGHSATCVTH
jgi:hypothetical protein